MSDKKTKQNALSVSFSDTSKSDQFLLEKLSEFEKGKTTKIKELAIIGILISAQLKEQGVEIMLNSDELKLGIYQDLDVANLLGVKQPNPESSEEKKVFKKIIS